MLKTELVIVGVQDFEAAARRLRAKYGLGCVEGFTLPGTGMGIQVVPFPSQMLEIVGIMDRAAAEANAFGEWFLQATAQGDRLLGWSVRTDDLEGVAARLGLRPHPGVGIDSSGKQWAWRTVGMERNLAFEPFLPGFFSWEDPAAIAGMYRGWMAQARHKIEAQGIAWVEVSGSASRLREWLGGEDLPVKVCDGPPAVRAVGVRTDMGVVVLGEML